MSNTEILQPARNYSSDRWKGQSLKMISKIQKFYLDYGPNQDLKISFQNLNGNILSPVFKKTHKRRIPPISPTNHNFLPISIKKGIDNHKYKIKKPLNNSFKTPNSKKTNSSSILNRIYDTKMPTIRKILDANDFLHLNHNFPNKINTEKKFCSTKVNNKFLKKIEFKEHSKNLYLSTKQKKSKYLLKIDHNEKEKENDEPKKLVLSKDEKEENYSSSENGTNDVEKKSEKSSDENNEKREEKSVEKKDVKKNEKVSELPPPINKNILSLRKFSINMSSNFRLLPTEDPSKRINKNIISSAFLSVAGISDGSEKTNQDSYLINENIFQECFNVYGVFDGHGDEGHVVSKYVTEYMNKYFTDKANYENLNQNNHEKISNIFSEKNEEIIKNCTKTLDEKITKDLPYETLKFSGTTSNMLYIVNDKLICSNVGDSRCVLFNCALDDRWTSENLSNDHKPKVPTEKSRILENGGEIHPYYDQDGIPQGPDRVYAKNVGYPGLSLTRTIGDLEGKKIGIISDAEIIVKDIENTNKYVVIGSDGLWDKLQPYDIIRIVRAHFNKGDVQGACQAIKKKVMQVWSKAYEERDDITIIVVFLRPPNNLINKNEEKELFKIIEENN